MILLFLSQNSQPSPEMLSLFLFSSQHRWLLICCVEMLELLVPVHSVMNGSLFSLQNCQGDQLYEDNTSDRKKIADTHRFIESWAGYCSAQIQSMIFTLVADSHSEPQRVCKYNVLLCPLMLLSSNDKIHRSL